MANDEQHGERYRLPRAARVTSRRDYRRIYDTRCSESDDRLVVYAAANEAGRSRAGLVVSTRLGGAVVRNRYKRLLREAFRLTQHDLPAGFDFLLIPRGGRGQVPATLAEYRASLAALARRAARRAAQTRRPDVTSGEGE
jgi:ribonuclease P protein component